MDKSSKEDFSMVDQVRAWNDWNEQTRGNWTEESKLNVTSRRQAAIVEESIAARGRNDLSILEVGCGAGWLCQRLARFGHVIGTDLADEVLKRAAAKWPDVKFLSGDFMTLDLPRESFDVVVTLEVLSHIADQAAFIARIASLLKPEGQLILATQNRPVLERWSAIGGPSQGQLRHWVDAKELRRMLAPHFSRLNIRSVVPVGDQGLLRLVNSAKLNRVMSVLVGAATLERLKEMAMLGHTLIAVGAR